MFKVRKWRELNSCVFEVSEENHHKSIADIAKARQAMMEERER